MESPDAYDDGAACVTRVRELALYDLLRLRLTRTYPVAPPAAGADFSIAVPPGMIWEVLAVEAVLTTSAAVTNRRPHLTLTDPVGKIATVGFIGALTATIAWRLCWLWDFGSETATVFSGGTTLPTFGIPSLAGQTVGPLTENIDVGDQWSGVLVTVREWSVGQVYWLAAELGLQLSHEVPTDLDAGDVYAGTLPDQPAPPAASQEGWWTGARGKRR